MLALLALASPAHDSHPPVPAHQFYYNFVAKAGNGTTVEFVMLDTIILSGQAGDDEDRGEEEGAGGAGPAVVDDPRLTEASAEAEWQWLEQTLKASTATYLVVAGHL